MTDYLRIEKYMKDQELLEEKLNSLQGHSNITNETYPKYWLELKKEVEEISKKVKIIEMKKNI